MTQPGDTFTTEDGSEVRVLAASPPLRFAAQPRVDATAPATFDPFAKYHPDQPRDERGRFADIAGSIAARTLIEDGDTASYHGKQVISGKAVSPYPERSQVIKGVATDRPSLRAFLTEEIRKFRRANADLLSQPEHALGTWYDTSTHDLWLDVVVVVDSADAAARLARAHNQIAYFDLDTGQEVRTGGTGLSKRRPGRLRGWLNARGGRSAPVQDDGVERRGDRRGDRGRPVGFDPLGVAKQAPEPRPLSASLPNLSPRERKILAIIGSQALKAFNPNQPRHPKGHPLGGQWVDVDDFEVGDRIAPHYQQPYETPSGRGGVPANFDATRMSAMTPEFLANLDEKFEAVGIEDIPDDLIENLDMLMERIKREHPDLVEMGEHWYANAQARIAEHAAESGVPLDTAIGMTAAMSPNSEWGQNVALAGEMMRQLKADEPIVPTDADMKWLRKKSKGKKGAYYKAMYERLRDGETPRLSELSDREAAVGVQLVGRRRELVSENPTLKGTFGKVAFATGTANMAKAIAIHRGADPDAVLGGHKVRSFYNNLSDPYDSRGVGDVTIDTHAASAAQLFRMPMVSKRADQTVWTGASGASNQQGAYPIYADAFRAVAAKHGMTANQAQAVLWVGWQQVRHEYPGIVVSEDAKTLASGLRQQDVYGPARNSTVGRYGVQVGAERTSSSLSSPPRYRSQVSKWQQYQDGVIDWAEYARYLAITPS